jgi:HAD superfamily hydrolase (TIGR01509 family)
MDAYLHSIPAKENVIPVLEKLKADGAKLNILTASPHITLDPCLKRLGMYDLFDNVWSCDDFATTKADPEIYRQVALRLGERVEDILFLDDNLNADRTAKLAGMQVCGVYDDSSKEYVEQMQAENDYYIFNFSELLSIQ